MKWSRYSCFFQSKRNGWLLYNSASNAFYKIENELVPILHNIMKNPEDYDFSSVPQLYILLRTGGFLIDDSRDDDIYNILKMRRITQNYVTNTLLLTVAVTRNCNFDCSYCYEGNRTGSPMTEEVEDKIISFIGKHHSMKKLFVTWYGGEPLLAMDRIRSMTRKIESMDKEYDAMIVTNGYLLNKDIIAELEGLHIHRIQITLDGRKETHDSRRYLKNGGPTFDKILENLKLLMESDYKGIVNIRVNVDLRNQDEFVDVYKMIRNQFPDKYGKQISVYPGFVKGDDHPDVSCFFDSDLKGQFIADLAEKYEINALSVFPSRPPVGCTLTKRNAYVVGPEGELYKCWDDVGIPSLVVGSVDRFDNWNMPLIAEGMVACSYLDSQECRECFYFPICDGGCHKARMKNLHDNCSRDCCSYFKDHLKDLLELHYEQKNSG